MSIMFPEIWDTQKWLGLDENTFNWNRSKLNIYEEGNKLFVEAALPGLEPHEVEVTLHHGRLEIKGKKEQESEEKGKKFYHRSYQSFYYQTLLPSNINDSQPSKAELKDGILQIEFSKMKDSSSKKIEVKKG